MYKQLWPLLLAVIVCTEVAAMAALTQFGDSRRIVLAVMGIVGYLAIGLLFAAVMLITEGSKLAFLNGRR
jgi:hypothetical protein